MLIVKSLDIIEAAFRINVSDCQSFIQSQEVFGVIVGVTDSHCIIVEFLELLFMVGNC